MIHNLRLIAITVLLLISGNARAQNLLDKNRTVALTAGETVFVHANATAFVPGETLYYKIYCVEPTSRQPSSVSKIAYADLIASDGQKIGSQKLYVANGMAQGDFFIPASLATGSYKLIGYTNWTLNKSENQYFGIDIIIVNPFQKPVAIDGETTTVITPSNNSVAVTNGKTYVTRDRVTYAPKIPNGNYSVSVRKVETLPHTNQTSAIDYTNTSEKSFSPNTTSGSFRKPELRGELITGKITSKSNASVAKKKIAITAVASSFGLEIGQTDATGKFAITLDKKYPATNIIVQIVDDKRDDFTLVLDQNAPKLPLTFKPAFTLDPSLKSSIEDRSVASQIENAFSKKKTDSITAITNKLFFEPLGKDYVLDDYTRFPSFRETIVEVVTELYFTQNDGKYQLHLRDYSTQLKLDEPVLVMVDGLLIQNINELFDYRMENVRKITVVPGGYFYGAATFSGIINIVTKNGDFVSKAKGDYIASDNTLRPAVQKLYYNPDYSEKTKLERIPDYRMQLLWLPTFYGGNEEISFFTSDVKGIFEIATEGFSSDGKAITRTDFIEVK